MDNTCTTDDIEALVTRWYFQKKQKIPDADKEWLRVYREQEGAVEKDVWKEPLPDVPEGERKELGPKEKPAYGTKEFWKDWWVRKKEKERIAAESVGDPKGSSTTAGLPLEPEKKKKSKKAAVAVTPEAAPAPVPAEADPGVEAITGGLSTLTLSAPVVTELKKVKLVRKKVVVET